MSTATALRQPQVGQFFVCSWGYDQTNIDFYKIIALTPKGVKVQRWTTAYSSSNGPSADMVVPGDTPHMNRVHQLDENGNTMRDEYGMPLTNLIPEPIMTKRLSRGYDHPAISINSYSSATLWDGVAEYQTATGWGH